MSRRDRRAALARGKTEPTANLTELAGRATLAFQEGRSIDAEVLCRQILALDSRQPIALNIVGLLYQASGNHRLAAKTLAKAVAANELDAACQYNLASSYQALGQRADAARHYRKALALEGNDPAVNNELAWFLATSPEPRLRDAARALRLAQKVVAAQPESANYRNTLGVALYRAGQISDAVAELEGDLMRTRASYAYDRVFLAMCRQSLGQPVQAVCLDIIGGNRRLLLADQDAKPDIVAFRTLRFVDRAIAQFDGKGHRPHRHGISLVGAGAFGGGDQLLGKIQQCGLIEQRCHRGW